MNSKPIHSPTFSIFLDYLIIYLFIIIGMNIPNNINQNEIPISI